MQAIRKRDVSCFEGITKDQDLRPPSAGFSKYYELFKPEKNSVLLTKTAPGRVLSI